MTWQGRLHFRTWMLEQHYAPKTIEAYVSHVRRCHELLKEEGLSLKRATADDLRLYLRTLEPTATSWNQARHGLGAYYRSIGRKTSPVDDLPSIPEPIRLPRPLSPDEHAQFLAASHTLGDHYQVFGLLLATTGARFSGVRFARWEQFDLAGNDPTWRIQGKGHSRRGPKPYQVPIHSTVLPVLRAWRIEGGSPEWVLPNRSGSAPVDEKTLRNRFRDICDQAGLENVVPHMLRHTVATTLLELVGDIKVVGDLLGHEQLSTTARYTKVLPSRLRDAVEQLPA